MTDVSTRVPRTSSWKSQPGFDKILADLKVSGLIFLRDLYNKEIRDFPNHFDLEDEVCQREYLAKIRRHHMINDELRSRHEYYEPDLVIDHETSCIYDADNQKIYSVYFNENESRILVDESTVYSVGMNFEEQDYELFKEGDTYYQYSIWNYLDEDDSA